MTTIQNQQMRFSSGPAAANLYCTINNVDYRLCFDWSFDYLYWKNGSACDIEVNLIDLTGLELINSTKSDVFISMCEQMVTQTQYHNYNRINENRARIMLMLSKLKAK